ncbi:S8 family peptidase [Streptomyces sp. WAC06614]|uniref:S8 family peptidase n=1 Tax=Streptomyces sp. WAC06614 TaxID=2487416 RepID=UPI0021AF2EA1|nr:S8 family peptidase [Streptomyces sp. WAC06614]
MDGSTPLSAPRSAPAPLYASPDPIPGRYIVAVQEQSTHRDITAALPGIEVERTYSRVLNGFSAALTPAQLDAVRHHPSVLAVEQDAEIRGDSTGPGSRSNRVSAASWGLDRIDQRDLPLDGQYNVKTIGLGVNAYVIDSGIEFAHPEFGLRARRGFDAVGDGQNGNDCDGHGTQVAGVLGGKTYGVARGVSLISVRVLNCENSGSSSKLIAGMDWVALHGKQPAVVNISAGGTNSRLIDEAANRLAEQGFPPFVSAGNLNVDACTRSPAGAERSIAVSSTNKDDSRRQTNAYGPCVWIFAPGTDIETADLTTEEGTTTASGTSVAAPHVAGVAALYKGLHPLASTETVRLWLAEQATEGRLTGIGTGSPNRLLYTGGL